MPDNAFETSRGLKRSLHDEKVIGVLATDFQTPSIRFTTPAAIIGEEEDVWFHRRSYRTVTIVFLRENR